MTGPAASMFRSSASRRSQEDGRITIRPADQRKAEDADFLMLKDGQIYFEGSAATLRASADPYLKRFLS